MFKRIENSIRRFLGVGIRLSVEEQYAQFVESFGVTPVVSPENQELVNFQLACMAEALIQATSQEEAEARWKYHRAAMAAKYFGFEVKDSTSEYYLRYWYRCPA